MVPKQGNALSQLLFNFALKYALGNVQENEVRKEAKDKTLPITNRGDA
jgi:hypothetical protein